MLRSKTIIRFTFIGSILAWLILLFSDLTILFSDLKGLPSGVPLWMPRVMLDLYIISLFYYYKFKIDRDDTLNFPDLLWKVFATGLIATVVSLALRLVESLLGTTVLVSNILFTDFIYQINLALFISFLLCAFMAWKRLILYQKSKWLLRTWSVFEFGLFFILIYDSVQINLSETMSTILVVAIGLLALVLSANMRWVAYLNFKQKWTCLLLLLLTFFYLGYFIYTVIRLSEVISTQSPSFFDFNSHVFNLALLSFVFGL